jgi:UrcA family protein
MGTGKRLSNVSLACLAMLGVAALSGAGSAAAAQATERSVTIGYKDLDLTTRNGADALYARLSGAARLVCGDSGRTLTEQRAWDRCYTQALSVAVARVDNPLLSGDAQRGTIRTAMLGR